MSERAPLKIQKDAFGTAPGLWKADVDSAFRRVPVREAHKWATGYVSCLCFAVKYAAERCDT